MSNPIKCSGKIITSKRIIGKTIFTIHSEFNQKTPYSKVLDRIVTSKLIQEKQIVGF